MDFATIVDEVLEGYFLHNPVHATEIGHHAFDGDWPDLTDAGRDAYRTWLADASARLDTISSDDLNRGQAIDRRVLDENLAAARFAEETVDELSWNPLGYVYLFGNGLFHLLAREFAPSGERLLSAASRMSSLPAAIDQARLRLQAVGSRPISRFHTEKAIERTPGLL